MIAEYFEGLAAQFTNPVTAVAQILGFIPIVLSYLVFHSNKRNTIIATKAISDSISVAHFLLLGQPTGAAVCTVNVLRGITFSQKGKYAWASGIWMPVIFCSLTIGSSLLSWTGPESLLPMCGSCLAVMGYWCQEPRNLRLFNFIGLTLWIIYGVVVFSVPTMAQNIVANVSIALTQYRVSKAEKQKSEV